MKSHLPRFGHSIPILGLLTEALIWMVGRMFEERILALFPWHGLTFATITIILLIFWAGAITQDLYNPNSWIRKRWSRMRKLFEIEFANTPMRVTPETESLEIMIALRIYRNIRRGQLTIRIHSKINPVASKTFVLHAGELIGVEKDQNIKRVLGVVGLRRSDGKAIQQSWGEKVENGEPLFDGSENICEIEMRSGWRRQVEKIFIAVLHKNSHEHGRVFISRQLV